MKRFVDFLAPLGLLLVVGAVSWQRQSSTPLPGKLDYYLIAGAALVLLHLVLRAGDIGRAIGHRQLRYGGNTFLFSAIVLGILIAVNWLAYRNPQRLDVTKNQRYSLSDQTKKVLAGLKEDVKVTYFQRTADMAPGQDRMKLFESATTKLKVEYVDPVKNPGRAREMDVTTVPTLVLERGPKREKLTNDGEQDVTNALLKVTRDGTKTVCFAEGEGERDIDDSSEKGFSGAKALLTKSQYQTKKVLLLREKAVPADCTVFVLAGPQNDLLPLATEALASYVKGGGKLFVMLDPEMKEKTPNVDAMLKAWNLESGHDVVVDDSGVGQLFGMGPFTPLAAEYPFHEITRDFKVATAYHLARSLGAGTGTVEGITAQNLIQTSERSWAETDTTLKQPIQYDPGKDRNGPITLGAVATVKAPAPAPTPTPSPAPSPSPDSEEPKKPEGRVVAIGDSDFVSNALLGFPLGNKDFFLNTVAWLAQDQDLISIRPRDPEDQRLALSPTTQQNIAIFALLVLPGLFVVAGVATWWRRR